MRKLLVLFLLTGSVATVNAQTFETQIKQITDSLSNKINRSGKKRIAIMDFANLDQSQNQLGVFLCDEISADLAVKSQNQEKYRILERSNLDVIFEEKKLIKSIDGARNARELGRVDAADALITGVITDIDDHYHIVIKLLDTKTGDALNAYKIDLLKTPWLEKLYMTPINQESDGKSENETPIVNGTNPGPTVTPPVLTTPKPAVDTTSITNTKCKEKKTGDYRFTNSTNIKMSVKLFTDGNEYMGAIWITVLPGQSEWAYELKSGKWNYIIYDVSGFPSYEQQRGQIMVEECKRKYFTIK